MKNIFRPNSFMKTYENGEILYNKTLTWLN